MVTLPPKLHHLGLASCNMKEFPRFSADAKFIEHIDLSKNELHGEIPHGIGSMSWDLYSYLNLSRNRLTGGLEHINWNDIWYLDIQSNLLNGSLPNLFCNSSSLKILNLSYNNLSGVLPICQTNLTRLLVFDLRMNNIQGNIPPTFSNFRNLKSINLYGNKLEGRVPTSFSELEQLETLDLGSKPKWYAGIIACELGLKVNISSVLPKNLSSSTLKVLNLKANILKSVYFLTGLGYGGAVAFAFIIGNWKLLARKPKWFAGIIAMELGLKIRRVEIKWNHVNSHPI
ncbi:hypothetical protein AgCh_027270 [Apium graveolens]